MADRDNYDALMGAMLMKKMLNDNGMRVYPFKAEVVVTPISIDCICEGNKSMLEDIEGGEEWFKETVALIEPIMGAQTEKFSELVKKRFGFEVKEAETSSAPTLNFDEFLTNLFGGGKQ